MTRHPIRVLNAAGLLIAAAILLATGIVILQERARTVRDAERGLAKLNVLLADQTSRAMQGVDLVLSSLLDRFRAQGIRDPEAFGRLGSNYQTHELLRTKMSGLSQIDALSVVDRRGQLINFSRSFPVPEIDLSDRDYFRSLRILRDDQTPGGQNYVSAPVQNRGTGTWTIYLARRVEGPDGSFLGLVLGAIELRFFEDLYRTLDLGPGSSVALWRRDGTLLARYPDGNGVGKTYAFTWSSDEATRGGYSFISVVDGSERIGSTRFVRDFPLALNINVTRESALLDWRRQALILGCSGLFVAIAALILVWTITRQLGSYALLTQARAEREDAMARHMRSEAADRAKNEFLAHMSHELRTPLNAVIGFSEMMAGEMLGPIPARYRTYAEDIRDSGSHLLRIINDILDVSKIEAGRMELREETVDLRQTVRQVAQLLRPRAEAAGIAVDHDGETEPLLIYVDERLIKQVLLNLVGNAVKFTHAGGSVRIDVSRDPSGRTELCVADTGIGIAPEDLDRIIEPFVQVEGRLNRRFEGTGLGLPLSKGMVELHGGALGIASVVGTGTTIRVVLPASRSRTLAAGRILENETRL